jgi:hypothetical protein
MAASIASARRRTVHGTETLGVTTEGGTAASYVTGYEYAITPFTPTYTGTLTTISIWAHIATDSTCDIKLGIYEDVSGVPRGLVTGSFETIDLAYDITQKWHDFSCSIPVTSSTLYWFGLAVSVTNRIVYYYATATGKMKYKALSYASSLDTDFNVNTGADRLVSIKATNTF